MRLINAPLSDAAKAATAVICTALTLAFSSCIMHASQQADEAGLVEEEDEEEAAPPPDQASALPQPSAATAAATRSLIAMNDQPGAGKLFGCFDQVGKIANDTGNQTEMTTAAGQISKLASSDPSLYHFCFFQMMVRLDERLDRGGPMMTDLATVFFNGMKELWIFAKALDALSGRSTYFDYLQGRYVQLSKTYFGRAVQQMAPPDGLVH